MTAHSSADHKSGAKIPEVRETSQRVWGVFNTMFFVLATLFLLFITKGCRDERKETARVEQATRQQSAPVPRVVVREVRVGKEKRSFRFDTSASGCVPIFLNADFEHYVFGGGTITIQNPNGKLDTVLPGADWRPTGNQPVGIYTFCKSAPVAGDSLVVWTRWSN